MPQGRGDLSGPVPGGNSGSQKRLDRPGKCGSGSSRAGCSRISCAQPQELPPAAVFHALRRRVQSLFHNQVIEIQRNSAIGAFFASPGASALQCALREVVAVGCTELSTGDVDNEILSFTTATWRRFVSPDATMRGNCPTGAGVRCKRREPDAGEATVCLRAARPTARTLRATPGNPRCLGLP